MGESSMLMYYLNLAMKSVRRTPVMSALMVLALGLGIGAFMTTFTVYYLMSGNPIPHKSDVLYAVQLDNWDPNSPPTRSPRDVEVQLTYQDTMNLIRSETPAKSQLAMYNSGLIVQPESNDDAPFRARTRVSTTSFFPMFDVPFIYGSSWDASEDFSGRRVAVISREVNDRLFEGEDSVGRSLRMNDHLFEVVGVIDNWELTPRFYHVDTGAFLETEDVFVPLGVSVELMLTPGGNVECWKPLDGTGIEAFLRSECVWFQYWAELENEAQRAEYQAYLENYVRSQKELGRFPRPLNVFLSDVMTWLDVNEVVSNDNRVLMRLSFLFLVVCVLNTVGLLLAKFLGKAPEVALRRAMGARKRDIVRQNLVEVALVGVGGGLAGIGFAKLGLLTVDRLYRGYDHLVQLDLSMLSMAIACAVIASLIAGLYPVRRAAQLAPAGLLKTQ